MAIFFLRVFVSTLPKPQYGGPLLVGYPLLLIQYIHSYPPYWRPLVHPQPEDALFRGDRVPHIFPCYPSVQNLSSSSMISKHIKIKIYRKVIFPVVLYGCETWSHILKEEPRLRVFQNRVPRRIFGPERGEVTGK